MTDITSYKDLVYQIIGVSMRVHSELRYGLLEKIYEEAISIELSELSIPHKTQEELLVYYKGHLLKKRYKMDIVVGDVICELKSANRTTSDHRAQLCNYLRLSQKPIGLLINFGKKKLEGERWAYDKETNDCFLVDVNMKPLNMHNIIIEDSNIDENQNE